MERLTRNELQAAVKGPAGLILAIDPGDAHVGWALGVRVTDWQWAVKAGEWTRAEAVRQVEEIIKDVDELVIEKFVLDPQRAAKLAHSPMMTSELIGQLKHVAKVADDTSVVMQGPDIKRATRGQLRARKVKMVGVGSHARDAELHLYYRLLRSHSPITG